MVCPCTLDGVCVVCPGTSELVGQHEEVAYARKGEPTIVRSLFKFVPSLREECHSTQRLLFCNETCEW